MLCYSAQTPRHGNGISAQQTTTTTTPLPPTDATNGKTTKTQRSSRISTLDSVEDESSSSAKTNGHTVVGNKYRKFLFVGQDTVAPSDKHWSTHVDEAVILKVTDSGPSSSKPVSVMTMMTNAVLKYPNKVALAVKAKGEKQWTKSTYSQYYENVIKSAKGFIKLGLERHHAVGIIGFNSPEWFYSDLAAIYAGGISAGMYTTNSPEACQYVLENCSANIVVVENDIQLQKILTIKNNLPDLRAIIQYTGELKEKLPFVYTWAEFIEIADDEPDNLLEDRINAQCTNHCATLIYTSGTTGNPKGVMLSHDNITFTALASGSYCRLRMNKEITVSYLPLSHIAAKMLDIYGALHVAATVYFAQPDALKGTLGQTLKEVQPTYFMGVPRVWEKIHEKLKGVSKNITGFRKKISTWAKGIGLKGNKSVLSGQHTKYARGSYPFGWTIANSLVFKKVRSALGFDRCELMLSGAAPISKETMDYFLSINIPIMEVYGMSESTGPHSVTMPFACKPGSVGKEIVGMETILHDQDAEGNGEICMKGRHVMMGYLDMKEKTMESIDEEGKLHSGDLGLVDEDGYLYITGRIKELIITAGGENIAPVPIEDLVKEKLPIVSNCMLIGDKRKFMAILLALKVEVDEETGSPKDQLAQPALDWCQSVGCQATCVKDVIDNSDEGFMKGIQAGIDAVNALSASRAQKIQKWTILPRDFSIPGEELGPTLKLKRSFVSKMYAQTIDSFYED